MQPGSRPPVACENEGEVREVPDAYYPGCLHSRGRLRVLHRTDGRPEAGAGAIHGLRNDAGAYDDNHNDVGVGELAPSSRSG